MTQFHPDICCNFLLFPTLFFKHFQLGFRLGKTDFLALFRSLIAAELAFYQIQFAALQEISVHPVFLHMLLYALVKSLDMLQLFHSLFHILKSTFHILIGAYVLPEYVNIDLFFIQDIGVNKVLNVVNGLKCKGLWNQAEELIFNSSKPCCDHFTGFHIGFTPLADINVGAAELCNGFHLVSIQEKVI